MDNFVHLHNHSSQGSMLDALSKITDIFDKMQKLDQPAIALTEHGTQYSTIPGAVEAQKRKIHFIPGLEAYVVDNARIKDKNERSSEMEAARKHLILLAKDNDGYKRLTRIGSWGMTEGFYYRPRIDDSILREFGTEGLIASSACFVPSKYLTVITKSGEVKNLLEVNAADQVKTHTGEWKSVIIPTTRDYEGNLYTVYTTNEFPMTVTENHKFLVLRKDAQKISDDYKYLNLWYNDTDKYSWIESYRGSYVPEWLEVQKIQRGDFLLYPINIDELNIEETRQYILSQIDNFTLNEQNYRLISTDLNYVCNIRDKLNQLLVCSWIYDRQDYYELVLYKCKLEQIKENKLYPINMAEIPFEFEEKLYLRRRVNRMEQSFNDKIQVRCLNVDQDHSFVINNVISSNCIASSIAQYILRNNYEAAKKKTVYYQELFHGDFYLELMPHLGKQVEVNKGLLQLHNDLKVPLILTSDSHYVNAEDKEAHDVLLCTQQRTTLNDPKRWKFEEGFYYIMSREELINIFQKHHPYISLEILNEAADNTVKIASQCCVEFTFGKHYLPKIDPYIEIEANPKLKQEFTLFETRRLKEIAHKNQITIDEAKNRLDSSNEYIRFLTIHGWHGMYQQNVLDARHLSLLMYELDVIISLGFSSYFLILEELIRWCTNPGTGKEQIFTGVSRGCFATNNRIKLLNSEKFINDIEINDQVLGLDNKYHKVLKTYEYDCDEDLIQIETENNKKIEGLTKDHKVLGLKKDDYIEEKEYMISDFKWYEIDDLDINDYIAEIN